MMQFNVLLINVQRGFSTLSLFKGSDPAYKHMLGEKSCHFFVLYRNHKTKT